MQTEPKKTRMFWEISLTYSEVQLCIHIAQLIPIDRP